MKHYRKKPVVIQAEAWMGTTEQFNRFVKEGIIKDEIIEDGSCIIPTLEGNMKASFGDYIIKGVEGQFYPCRSDIFNKTYIKAE